MKHGVKYNEKLEKWKYVEKPYKFQTPIEIIEQLIKSRIGTAEHLIRSLRRDRKPREFDYLNERKKITRINDVEKIMKEVKGLKSVLEVIKN